MIAFFLQLKEEKEIGTNYKLPKQTVTSGAFVALAVVQYG